tara:strand:- start:1027 stop:1593 length:567 start_codon:yes stop_codon:yes gene_type:complete
LNAEITRHLENLIHPNHVGLEPGSGASTVWFAQRCGHLTSIEHDPAWAQRVSDWLRERNLFDKVDMKLCERGPKGTPESYVDSIAAFSDNSLDFILIDGKKRDSCAIASLPRLKPGGHIIVDDVHRYIANDTPSHAPYSRGPTDGDASLKWEKFVDQTKIWPRLWKSDGISDTAIWTKPIAKDTQQRL